MSSSHNTPTQHDIIIGRQPVLEALKSGRSLEKILILFGTRGAAIDRIRAQAQQRGVPVAEASRQRFRELAGDAVTQGVAAVISTATYVEIEDLLEIARQKQEQPFLLVLDGVEDPQNVGALIRTAECAGVHGIILPKHHSALVGYTVAKTSAGASLLVPLAKVPNIAQAVHELKQNGLWVVGTATEGDRLYDAVDYTGPLAIVVGNEGRGIRRLVKEQCDVLVRIPLYGKIESLNASVAGALVLFQAAQKRHEKKA
jgi:23S rRNA (guanosine2251-2'-O)-methyltransferase